MYSSFQVIDDIKKKLTRRQAELFEKTCFGHFLKLQRVQLSGQLVHHILLRQLICPNGENSMLFRIAGKECEFSLKDFALITGLDCSEYVPLDLLKGKLSNRICDKYFHRKDKVLLKVIAHAFKTYKGKCDDDAVKLAQLYLLEGFLLSKQTMTACHNFFIQLVDNADEFDKFPWGRFVYEFTVKSMKCALEVQVKKLGKKLKQDDSTACYEASYVLKGFPYALQYWAYECIPLISEKFGVRINTNTPRMLNWAFGKQPNFEKLKKEVFNGDEFQVESGLQPMENEMHEDYFRYFLGNQRLKERTKTAIIKDVRSPEVQAEETVMKGKDFEKSSNGGEIHMNEEDKNIGKNYNDMMLRKAQIEGENDPKSELLALMREEMRKTVREEISKAVCALRDEMRVNMTEIAKQQSNVTDTDFDVVSVKVDDDNYGDQQVVQRKRKRCNVPAEDEIPCFTVDLFEHPNHDERAEFDEWIKVGLKRNNKKKKYSDLSNQLLPGFDFTILKCEEKDWFFSLNETAQWLSSSHIDVALYFMRKKKKDNPDVFQHRCTTTDSVFYSRLNSRYTKFKQGPENFLWDKEALIQKTLTGLEPCHSLPWVDVDTVYIPVNVNKKHWVVAALDLIEQRLHVYDSYHAAMHDKEVMLACRPIAEMVPWILRSEGFFDARHDIHVRKDATTPFDVELVHSIPQQENGGDCGMFMLKFTEFLMQGMRLDKINQQAIPFFRNKMAVELYAYGKKKMAKE